MTKRDLQQKDDFTEEKICPSLLLNKSADILLKFQQEQLLFWAKITKKLPLPAISLAMFPLSGEMVTFPEWMQTSFDSNALSLHLEKFSPEFCVCLDQLEQMGITRKMVISFYHKRESKVTLDVTTEEKEDKTWKRTYTVKDSKLDLLLIRYSDNQTMFPTTYESPFKKGPC